MKTAIILSGGGSKGSYELGVWKALRKLHIKYSIVTGTSIGALNGALMTEKSYFKAKKIWKKLNLEYLFDKKPKSMKNIDVFNLFRDSFLQNGGENTEKIEQILKETINIRKFYKSNIDFGLITYNFTDKTPLCLTKREIPEDKLLDYLMASATCFPAFKMKDIDGSKFIDGGFYDNIPVNLAIEMGADNLIIVDLEAPGVKRKLDKKLDKIIIKPKNKLSFFLTFDEKEAKTNFKYGYNDTLKAFHKLEGNYFTFKNNHLKNYYNKNKTKLDNITYKEFQSSLESLGKIFKLDDTKIYSLAKYKRCLKQQISYEKKIPTSVIKEIKTLKTKASTKLITLFFLSNLEQNKNTSKLNLIFKKEKRLAQILFTLGVTYDK